MAATRASETLVIQSHRDPLPFPWLAHCIDSVKHWAALHQFDYRWVGDECFSSLPADLWQKTREQLVIASDLARLYLLQRALEEGYHSVVWCDADFLVINPERLQLPQAAYAFGREVWVQAEASGKNRARVKIHNAFMTYRRGKTFLPFYIETAERLLTMHQAGMPPQFIGPKLLTALHNMLHFDVVENAGMLSPPVMLDLLRGGGDALTLFLSHHRQMPAAVNLSASLADESAVAGIEMMRVIDLLRGTVGTPAGLFDQPGR